MVKLVLWQPLEYHVYIDFIENNTSPLMISTVTFVF